MTTVSASVIRRFPAFASPDFRRLFFNAFFTSAARWALMLARGWLVFELTESSFAVGVVTFASMVQFIVVGPIAGAVADRLDRRQIALAGGVLLFLSSAALAALTLGGVAEVWHVVVLAAVDGIAVASSQPAIQSLVPNVVPREHLLNAVSLSGITRHGSRLIGPLFGGVLLATLGAGSVFLLSAIGLVFATAMLWRVELRLAPNADRGPVARNVLADVAAGFGHVRHDGRIAVVLLCVAFHCGFTMAFDSLLPQLATNVGGGSRTFSAIVMGVGAGAIVGTISLSMVRQQVVQGYALALTGIGSGIAMVVLGFAATPVAAVVGAVLAGGTQATYMAVSLTLIQQIVPDALRGRVMSIYMMLAAGHMAMMNFGFGWAADRIGVRPLMVVPGLLWIAVFVIAALSFTELRHVLRRGVFVPRLTRAATPEAAS
ncbi:MAG: MFS transporter [Chloroflexi bacterium]|nr:MFS transporter [Chloroflexota bacterium]MQC27451.1 MFS transporter [Chloroflexota bacterium]